MFFLAASITENPTILESIRYQSVGFTVVMLTLASLWVILEIMGFIFRRLKLTSPSGGASVSSEKVDPEVVAVIAAAVESVVKQPHRITSIEAVQVSDHAHTQAWAMEGRRDIHANRGVR